MKIKHVCKKGDTNKLNAFKKITNFLKLTQQ